MQNSFVEMSNSALFKTIFGTDVQLGTNSLLEIFGLVLPVEEGVYASEERATYLVRPEVAAFKELYLRAMNESMTKKNCFSDPSMIKQYLRGRLAHLDHEIFGCLFLDAGNALIKDEILFTGTLSQTSVYPREIVKNSLAYNTSSIIFYHNHPSGNSTPSSTDEILTSTLKKALSLVDVRVLDHFVISASSAFSMAEHGLM